MHDVIVIGGSYAGMAAALQLVRARRKVLVLDSGQRRNRFASHSYGFLGQDGIDPAAIWSVARKQLSAYPTLDWLDTLAGEITGRKDAFHVIADTGGVMTGRRILLATGMATCMQRSMRVKSIWSPRTDPTEAALLHGN